MTDIEPIKKTIEVNISKPEPLKLPVNLQDLKRRAVKIAQDIRELHIAMGLTK